MCVKDCGLHNQKYPYDNFILVGWFDAPPIEIKKKLRHDLEKTVWAYAIPRAFTRATILGTLCTSLPSSFDLPTFDLLFIMEL